MAREHSTPNEPLNGRGKLIPLPKREDKRQPTDPEMREVAMWMLEQLQALMASALREHERVYHGRSNTITFREGGS